MAGFAILRLSKLKSLASVGGSSRHILREQETPNADPDLIAQNQILGAKSTAAVLANVRRIHGEIEASSGRAIRSDAVPAIEVLMTYSPDSAVDYQSWAKRALEWVRGKFGAENIVTSALHLDEKTPHIHAIVVPRTTTTSARGPTRGQQVQTLSAATVVGGRKDLSALQDSYHAAVGAPEGLERGIRGSRATHTTVKRFYADLVAQLPESVKLSKSELAAAALGKTPAPVIELQTQLKNTRIALSRATERIEALTVAAQKGEKVPELEKQVEGIAELEKRSYELTGRLSKYEKTIDELKEQVKTHERDASRLRDRIAGDKFRADSSGERIRGGDHEAPGPTGPREKI